MDRKKKGIEHPAFLICLLLVAVTLGVYWNVQSSGFLLFDDHEYVVENPRVQSGLTAGNLLWAFTTTHASNWHPLTWLSHMLDCQLYGLNPAGHHLNNLLLHLANTALLFLLLRKMTGTLWQSAVVAGLFALHPVQVESVAWVAERKNLLSTLLWFMTTGAYVRYVERPGAGRYLLTLLLFCLGLMAKPMLVTLPAVLLLLDCWPLGRIPAGLCLPSRENRAVDPSDGRGEGALAARCILEKIPLFALAVLSALLTILAAESHRSLASLEAVSLKVRIGNALVSYVRYLWTALWPADLAFFYPHPLNTLPLWQITGAFLLLAAVSWGVIRLGRYHAYLAVGWFWYLVTLLPVIGLLQVGAQARADRYAYIPFVGLFIMAAWGLPNLLQRRPRGRAMLGATAALALSACAALTFFTLHFWLDSIALFERALRVTPGNYVAHFHLGDALARQGETGAAIHHFEQALSLKPDHVPSHHQLGNALARTGRLDGAVDHYLQALKADPRDSGVHYSLGNVFSMQGRLAEAASQYAKALQLDPDDGMAHNNLGFVLLRQEKYREAAAQFREALRVNPHDARARNNLGLALSALEASTP